MELLQRIQRWYTINCNGDWEHDYPTTITTLDNPGWSVTIILKGTCLKSDPAPYILNQRSTTDWFGFSIKDNKFEGVGGPENLTEILAYFLDIYLPEHIDPECTLDLHLPVIGYEDKLWLKAEAQMLSESTLQIVSIADSTEPASYEWANNEALGLINQLDSRVAQLRTSFLLGDTVAPVVYQEADNMLRTFLVAPPSFGSAE
jgi:hypothetical protein